MKNLVDIRHNQRFHGKRLKSIETGDICYRITANRIKDYKTGEICYKIIGNYIKEYAGLRKYKIINDMLVKDLDSGERVYRIVN